MQRPRQTADLVTLLARVAKQDRSAFSELYQATSAKLYGVIVRILVRRDIADDVLKKALTDAGYDVKAIERTTTPIAEIRARVEGKSK